MHILYFHQHFSTPKGSTGLRSYEFAKYAIQQGHQVTMVCGSYSAGHTGLTGEFVKGQRRGYADGIGIIEFDLSYSNHDGFAKRTLTFCKFAIQSITLALREDYDVLFATTTPLTVGLPGIAARWLRRKTFIFEVRDLWPELPREMGVIKNPLVLKLMDVLEFCSYRSARRLIGLSPGIVQGIARRGVNPPAIAMIPNGCDLGIFDSQDITPWSPDGIRPSDLVAVFAGTHGHANGLDAVLDAAVILKQHKRDDIKIVLIGNGKLKPELMARAKHQQLDQIIFLDPVSKDKLAQLFARADIGVQCLANVPAFYFGTSPNKFFDYIAASLPVLNNYPGWLAELITTHQCGFAVPPEDPHAFAAALEDAKANPEQLRVMGRNSKSLAMKEFDRTTLAKAWLDWLVEGRK